jgi:hypothetical protein
LNQYRGILLPSKTWSPSLSEARLSARSITESVLFQSQI